MLRRDRSYSECPQAVLTCIAASSVAGFLSTELRARLALAQRFWRRTDPKAESMQPDLFEVGDDALRAAVEAPGDLLLELAALVLPGDNRISEALRNALACQRAIPSAEVVALRAGNSGALPLSIHTVFNDLGEAVRRMVRRLCAGGVLTIGHLARLSEAEAIALAAPPSQRAWLAIASRLRELGLGFGQTELRHSREASRDGRPLLRLA